MKKGEAESYPPVDVPAVVWLVIYPAVGTLGSISGFRDEKTARAVAGRRPGIVVAGPFFLPVSSR
jgi:hypothetical protein